jgi:cytochrome b
MELLRDVGHMESCFAPFGDSVSVSARKVHGLRRTYHSLRNHFGHTRWDSLVTWAMWHLVSICLETMLVSMQDRCMVYAKHTIGL